MSDVAIRVENLSKMYHIGETIRQDTMRDAFMAGIRRSFARFSGQPSTNGNGVVAAQKEDEFWALKDVSFEVKRGEVVGIIGRNGAGKSTLLKILSRITEPTSGRAEIHGRVGSLLEVGTGFHPELTGRENIYLNGAILGMKRTEIDRKFDEIVDFAEIERFLDTPVKRYSSGMYIRLAFAVAAHLEPEILLVDEVLAVGDVQFQKKCLGKMGDVANEGRTVLFVSHNMAAINQLCSRCQYYQYGQKHFDGTAKNTIAKYLDTSSVISGALWDMGDIDDHSSHITLLSVECIPRTVSIGSAISIVIDIDSVAPMKGLKFGISIEDSLGQRIIGTYTGREGIESGRISGKQQAILHINSVPFVPGLYYVSPTIHHSNGENIVRVERATSFEVIGADLTNSGNLVDRRNGVVWVNHVWNVPQ